jgi:O-Antigen ligase.
MIWINHILFFIISLAGFQILFNQRVHIVKDGFLKNKTFKISNLHYLLLFIFSMSLLACGQHMANRMMVTMIMLVLAVFLTHQRISFSGTFFFYLFYLGWLILSILLITPERGYGFRVFLKYLYPFLIMLFASQLRVNAQFYFKVLKVIIIISLVAVFWQVILTRIPVLNRIIGSFIFWGPAIIDFYPVPLTISLLLYSETKKKKYLVYAVLFVIPSAFWAIRTGILAFSITVVLFAIIRYQIKSLPYVLVGIAIFIGSVLYIPQVRDKMFFKQMSTEEIIEQREELTTDDIDSSGRFAMWEWSLDRFYHGKEWTGSGTGVLQAVFYSLNHPFGNMRIVHNDYVQILCDNGLIGLILYLSALLSLIIHSLFVYFISKNRVVKIAAFIAGVSMAGMLSTLYTDNVVNYSMMTLSFPFALYGLFLSIKRFYSNVV